MNDAAGAARRMWTLFEPVHAVTYFTPEARAEFEAAGLRGFWRGYFAGRAAPMGRVGPAVVTASFYNFAPPMIARALPAVWDLITPEDALAARSAGAVAALQRLLDESAPGLTALADGLLRATDGLDCSGRVLAAANAAQPAPPSRRRGSGTRRPCCGSTAGTGTTPSCWPRTSTAVRRWC